MAIPLDNLTIDKTIELLNDNKVISRYKDYSTREPGTGKIVQKRVVNCFQFVKENDKYLFYGFDSFGNKLSQETKELSIEEMEKYISSHHTYRHDRSDKEWSYHTKKIPKKELNPNINNEADIKYLVYEWLLSLDKDLVIVPEFSIAERRADYMAFSKTETYLFEIKSEVDTLDRLEEQLKAYQKIGNYIYVAFHESKALKMKNVVIPDNVGLFIVANNKLKLIKKAKKNKIDKLIFESYVSYEEYSNCVYGLKYSSKFTKEQIIKFINETFTKKQRADFYYEIIRNRNEQESNKRKESFVNGDINSAIGRARLVGVNRMAPKGCTISTLVSFFNVQPDILYDYYTPIEQEFNCKYQDMESIRMMLQDPTFVRFIFDKYSINLFACNDLALYKKAISSHKQMSANWKKIKEHFFSYIENSINEVIPNENKLLIFTVYSSSVKKMLINQLSSKGFSKETILFEKSNWIPYYERRSEQYLELGKKIIINHVDVQYAFGLHDQEAEKYVHCTIDFKAKNEVYA